jgi:hypothetical protein
MRQYDFKLCRTRSSINLLDIRACFQLHSDQAAGLDGAHRFWMTVKLSTAELVLFPARTLWGRFAAWTPPTSGAPSGPVAERHIHDRRLQIHNH